MQSVKQLTKQPLLSLLIKTQHGFTLLEVMLAIVIIATITVFSISIFQQQAVNSQIDRTALQMQQWLEAAKAYYVNNNEWPDGAKFTNCTDKTPSPTVALLEGDCGPNQDNNIIYIQAGTSIENNIWGIPFVLLPPGTPPNKPDSVMFEIQNELPGSLDPQKQLALAQRIASRLPNATVDTKTLNVIAGVTIPGSASNNSGQAYIASVQDITCTNSGCTIPPKPVSCPDGMQPILHIGLQGFQTKADNSISAIASVVAGPQNYKANAPWAPTLNVVSASGQNHIGSLLAIITCEKTTTSNTNSSFTY